jgi:hypothetical protein
MRSPGAASLPDARFSSTDLDLDLAGIVVPARTPVLIDI